jgi:AraC-like DNA-binding protein
VKKRTGYRHECRGLLYGLFAGIEAEAADAENAAVHPLAAAQAYIHEHFTDGALTVGFLAQMCGVSEAHFRRLFAQRCGVSPLEYINGLRLKYALELLSSGYYTVTAASDACGFSSPYYFSAFIKRSTGYAPSDIIKNKNGQNLERNA